MESGRFRHLSSGFHPLRASGRTGDGTAGNLKMTKIRHYCIKAFHIHFVPSALSCALPAFLLFFLPGN
ncbi:unnamed protein product [Staurois parvus]|uniref:Uncharacterized protein n=1 Tax=Staurois parvus TaxID=386267 RepID=A0ABN9H098_9NEOB|nr:unnamed protein product [Staurois parvus]